ncbi:Uu.00g027660.m01.CDS01 [Anthostomella pinea]|uniref:Uu.00g027660.m01.CDS01 n=1 Tax=Anthostomella pinea TaxID=933095 RepID=A0AAI8V2Y4_9PEZI|nr:Uu.00g027660.m01.CDS01 [Anthostomella pinea]
MAGKTRKTRGIYARVKEPKDKDKTSDLAKADPARHVWTLATHISTELVAIGVLVCAIVLGAFRQNFALKTTYIFGATVDADLQLAFLGLINKILDLLVTKSLEVTAGVLVTLWMTTNTWNFTRKGAPLGARIADFELKDELTKPWAAVVAFYKRWSLAGWKGAGWIRLLVTLAVSVCLLLQGLAVNTLGVPKARWFPSASAPLAVQHPVAQLHGLDWTGYLGSSFNLVGGGDIASHVADGFIVSSANLAFQRLVGEMRATPYGWQQITFDLPDRFAALDSRHDGSAVVALRYRDARKAIGWTGLLKMATPASLVSCDALQDGIVGPPSGVSIIVNTTINGEDTYPSFIIHLLQQPGLDFPGLSCEVASQRLLFPAKFWMVDEATTADVFIDDYGKTYDTDTSALVSQPANIDIASALALQMKATTARLETLIDGLNAVWYMLAAARNLRTARMEYASDAEAMAPVLALLATRLLSVADWNVSYTDAQQVTSSPIQWQLFGSGPRLPWEWVTVMVVGVLILALLGSLYVSFAYRIVPGEWLKVGGMLIAANSSSPIEGLKAALGEPEEQLETMPLAVQENATRIGTVEIVRADKLIPIIYLRGIYRWA